MVELTGIHGHNEPRGPPVRQDEAGVLLRDARFHHFTVKPVRLVCKGRKFPRKYGVAGYGQRHYDVGAVHGHIPLALLAEGGYPVPDQLV